MKSLHCDLCRHPLDRKDLSQVIAGICNHCLILEEITSIRIRKEALLNDLRGIPGEDHILWGRETS